MHDETTLHSIDLQKQPVPKVKAANLSQLIPRTYSTVKATELLLADIREKLVGKTIKATGSVIHSDKRLYFIPRTVEGVF